MIKKLYVLLVVASFMAGLLSVPASAKAEDGPQDQTKSGVFIKPSSGLDNGPDTIQRKEASILSPHLPLSDTIDIGPVFEKPQKQDATSKKKQAAVQAVINVTFHF
jgi:hypothetical protein